MKIIMLMATSADGIIGEDEKQSSTDWTSSVDKKFFVSETKKHGVVIFGNTTFKTIGRPLPGRLNIILTSSPEKYKDLEQAGLLEFKKGSPQEIVKELESKGFESAILGGGANTNTKFLQDQMVDEIIINVHPVIVGSGLKIVEGASLNTKLELLESNDLGQGVIQLRYKVLYG